MSRFKSYKLNIAFKIAFDQAQITAWSHKYAVCTSINQAILVFETDLNE